MSPFHLLHERWRGLQGFKSSLCLSDTVVSKEGSLPKRPLMGASSQPPAGLDQGLTQTWAGAWSLGSERRPCGQAQQRHRSHPGQRRAFQVPQALTNKTSRNPKVLSILSLVVLLKP